MSDDSRQSQNETAGRGLGHWLGQFLDRLGLRGGGTAREEIVEALAEENGELADLSAQERAMLTNVLSLRESNFIKSDLVAGMSLPYILFSEILPNTAAPILVYATSVLALSMLDEAALSFLGMGVQPPTASLGNMLNGAQSLTVLTKQPWLWIPSGLMIVVLVIAINFIGDALRDALDPNSGK